MTNTPSLRPNIIFIYIDDLGYGDVGCYGSRVNDTPCIDLMAREGTLFSNFYVSASYCTPSRASLMTGCYAQRISLSVGDRVGVLVPEARHGLNPEEITIAELLQSQGYATAHIGKWHLGDQPQFLPTRFGFEYYFGIPYSNDMSPNYPLYKDKDIPPLPLLRGDKVIEAEPDQSAITARYTEEAVDFIREHKDGPFFLYLAHNYVHVPLYPSDEWRRKSRNGDYGAEVGCIDWSTGRILGTLKEMGIAENTLVIFSSDNGAGLGDGGSNAPLRGHKGTSWEGGQREPMIAWCPGTIPEGVVSAEVCTNMDFLPTFVHLAGGNCPTDRVIDGKDIWSLLKSEKGALPPHETFFYYQGHQLQAVRKGNWKLHLQRNMLVDLSNDIGETTNLVDKHLEIVTDLEALAENCREDLGDGEPGNTFDEPLAKLTRPGRNIRPCGYEEDPKPLVL